jgi:hypothetical protein
MHPRANRAKNKEVTCLALSFAPFVLMIAQILVPYW